MINEGDKFCQYCGSLVTMPEPVQEAPAAVGAVCASCGGALEDGDRFCQQCGTPVAAPEAAAPVVEEVVAEAEPEVVEEIVSEPAGAVCASCGEALEDGDRFCQHCGTPVAAPEVAAPVVEEVTEEDLAEIEEIVIEAEPEVIEEPEVIGSVCPECGGANDADSKFCQFCGAVLTAAAETVEETVEEIEEVAEEIAPEVVEEEVPEEVVVEEATEEVCEEVAVEEAAPAVAEAASVCVLDPMGYDYPYLVRRATREVIDVNKAFFRIGSEKSVNNYVVEGLGEMHAMIMTTAGKYFIVDLGTEGKTYVGGAEIAPDTEVELTAGCSVRLANEDFVFII